MIQPSFGAAKRVFSLLKQLITSLKDYVEAAITLQSVLPDSGNCPQIQGIVPRLREFLWCLGTRIAYFFFNSEHAQMGHVWSGHVQSVYNLVHVPDSCVRMHGSSFSSSDD